ncbi:DUF4376 domain-containing protein [Brucella anthropi]|uniref:DUF4376 domain-containing protein n=1 Tax=Brucella anthropi TaxID=529 RepID=UPI000697D504|nr:DUF4376 domain-containing protein [Brucella anthropi]
MTIYAQIDPHGFPSAFFDTSFHDYEVPAGAIEITKSQHEELLTFQGLRRLVNGKVIEFTPPPPIVDLAAYAAQKRWETEVGGTIWNGWPVLTDRESQNKITSEALAIEKGERLDGDPWKFADGEFRPLTNAQMDSLAAAVRLYIRESFAIEARVVAEIEAGTISTIEQIDAAFA